jgi:hypothetical protein
MATVTLTARYRDQLKSHGKRYEVFDAIVPGLAIRVSASGRKTFTLYYRHRRRMRRVGLGRYPDVLLEKARKIATQHRGRIFNGADPAGEKQTEHAQDDNTVQALTSYIASGRTRSCAAGPKSAASSRRKSCRPGGIGGLRISGAATSANSWRRRPRRPRSRAIACLNGSPRSSRLP